jgi:DNA phosphorothioation-associated putative methyltransferase
VAAGKRIADRAYFHITALESVDPETRAAIDAASELSGARPGQDFNVAKVSNDLAAVSLLDYPRFFEVGFPVLRRFWTCDLVGKKARLRTYDDSLNPPVLHRKELLLAESSPERPDFQRLTAAAEQAGLFEDPLRIGFLKGWEALLAQRGWRVSGNQLVPLGNDEAPAPAAPGAGPGIARHLTALSRQYLSAPVQSLIRLGLLNGQRRVFDYGCGRGDDVRHLREEGIDASGWDPHYAPAEAITDADIVNLGFVINVIEDPIERADALKRAYELANQLLVVSAMLATQDAVPGTPYGDGLLTSRSTFQKYFSQSQLKDYIAETLNETPIAAGPGIFYVFKDKTEEQRFLYGRLLTRRCAMRLAARPPVPKFTAKDRAQQAFAQHQQLLTPLWDCWVELGRSPELDEVSTSAAIVATFGTWRAALKLVTNAKQNELALIEQSRTARIDDLRVYFAKLLFERKRRYHELEPRLQRDVKWFFGGYQRAIDSSKQLLATLPSPEVINSECGHAAERGLGWFVESDSLQLHSSLVSQLSAPLRAYVECGTVLYGDVSSADLIKIHVRSGKLSLMIFDDFQANGLPKMVQRVKINLRTQEFDVYRYGGDFPAPYLYSKSRYINEEFPGYPEQVELERRLAELGLGPFVDHGPSPEQFDAALARRRYRITGLRLARTEAIPGLDERCGRHFSFRSFVECGETWKALGPPNVPRTADTFNALSDLALFVLDPVIEYFGMVKLTYGFCSPALAKNIRGRIAPDLDQHAGHEFKKNGRHVCSRLGAACDFLVEDEDMREVAHWVAENTPFDRLYFYGRDRPIHVSYGPQHSREFVEMITSDGGRLVPRVLRDVRCFGRQVGVTPQA